MVASAGTLTDIDELVGSIGNDPVKTNGSGFSVFPSGIRGSYGLFSGQTSNANMANGADFWNTTEAITASIVQSRTLDLYVVELGRIIYPETWGVFPETGLGLI
jgi:hypothetical protein